MAVNAADATTVAASSVHYVKVGVGKGLVLNKKGESWKKREGGREKAKGPRGNE